MLVARTRTNVGPDFALCTGFLEGRLEAVGASASGDRVMEVMPGAGNHSGAAGAKIKPECAKILTEKGLTFEDKTPGSWNVTL